MGTVRRALENEFRATLVPEPAGLSITALGAISLLGRRRRKFN
jgi:hypothetical protein